MNRHAGNALVGGADGIHVGEIQQGIDSLSIQVQGDGDEVEVAGALTVAEQGAFHAVGPGHQAEFGGRHAGAAVVVRVQADERLVAGLQVAAEPLDLVGVHVWRGDFNRGGQIQDYLVAPGRLPHIHHGCANFQGVIDFSVGEALRRVFHADVGAGNGINQALDQLRAIDGDLFDLFSGLVKSHTALQRRSGVIQVYDGVLDSLQALERASDQVFAGLHQHLHSDIVRDALLVHEAADEVELRVAGGGEPDFRFPCIQSSPTGGRTRSSHRLSWEWRVLDCRRADRRWPRWAHGRSPCPAKCGRAGQSVERLYTW